MGADLTHLNGFAVCKMVKQFFLNQNYDNRQNDRAQIHDGI